MNTPCQNCNKEKQDDELLCEDCEANAEAEMIAREDDDYRNDDIRAGLGM
jgi:hypothetical protein